ncbi:MAG TPA: arylsulfotransferase family protein [Solirubrobacteraceae bacterium]|nr:arylsulfotransferase family protein [Solirubrobacteraceae bacterium]
MSISSRTLLAASVVVVVAIAAIAGVTVSTGGTPPAPSCAPRSLNVSAAVAGGAMTVSPGPGTRDSSYETQISMLGVPAAEVAGVIVTGSRSGRHPGRLLAYSQGDGASFVPDRFFDQGEQVTVRLRLLQSARSVPVSWSFTTAERDTPSQSLETPPPPPPPPKAGELQHFASRPDLLPPVVNVTRGPSRAPGYIFLAPYAGPGQYGPMILDGAGRLVWFKPIPKGERAGDVRVQQYEGRPVLTWWQDPYVSGARRDGAVVIADSSYHTIKVVRGGNGYQPDLHAFQIAKDNTAVFTVFDAVRCDLSHYGGPANGAVADTVLQDIDLKTGLVRYEWHALDHASMSDSYVPMEKNGTQQSPWDWFHINVTAEHGGKLLVDSRNTWAAYFIDPVTGKVIWRLGGKKSSFRMGPEARPAWQHDLRVDPSGTVSFFDNGATPAVHKQSRVIALRLNTSSMTASLVSSFVHHPNPLVSPSQGDFQPLPDGSWFVGWGQEPYFSEYSGNGHLLFDAHMPKTYQTYTALKFAWTGTPTTAPVATATSSGHRLEVLHLSWNGATRLARWLVLAGATPATLKPVASRRSQGFETSVRVARARYLQALALDSGGQTIGHSRVLGG